VTHTDGHTISSSLLVDTRLLLARRHTPIRIDPTHGSFFLRQHTSYPSLDTRVLALAGTTHVRFKSILICPRWHTPFGIGTTNVHFTWSDTRMCWRHTPSLRYVFFVGTPTLLCSKPNKWHREIRQKTNDFDNCFSWTFVSNQTLQTVRNALTCGCQVANCEHPLRKHHKDLWDRTFSADELTEESFVIKLFFGS